MRAQFVQASDSLLLGTGVSQHESARPAPIGRSRLPARVPPPTVRSLGQAKPSPWNGILPLNGRMSLQHDFPGRYLSRLEKAAYFQNIPLPPTPSAMAAESVLPARKPDRTCPSHLTVALCDPQVVKDKRSVVGKRGEREFFLPRPCAARGIE